MITSTMVDSFDTPMVDYIEDADMSTVQSTSDNWYHHHQPSSGMEEDRTMLDEHAFQAASLEVDMVSYEDTTEYEMDDAANDHGPIVQEIIDAEVYDASIAPPSNPQTHEITTPTHTDVAPPFVVGHRTEGYVPHANEHAVSVEETAAPLSTEGTSLVQISEPPVQHHELQEQENVYSAEAVPVQETPAIEEPESKTYLQQENNNLEEASNETEQLVDGSKVTVQSPHTDTSPPLEQPQPNVQEGETSAHLEVQVHQDHAEHQDRQQQVHAEHSHADAPSILLTVHVPSLGGEQPDFALFTPPGPSASTSDVNAKVHNDSPEEILVLLQHRPNLFYEPISAVFEALRQEEYFSHLDDLMESEMSINAVDIQLSISEDNIYAREVSLQDLNAMHYGIGLSGPLRLILQSVYPRFITRYNLLRDQITRLAVTDGAEGQGQGHGRHLPKARDEEQGVAPVDEEVNQHEVEENLDAEEHGETEAVAGEEREGEAEQKVDGERGAQEKGQDENDNPHVDNEAEDTQSGTVPQDVAQPTVNDEKSVTILSVQEQEGVGSTADPENNLSNVADGIDESGADDADAEGEDDPDAEGELDEQQTEYNEIEQEQLEEDNGERYENEAAEVVETGNPALPTDSTRVDDGNEEQQYDDAAQGVGDEVEASVEQEQVIHATDGLDQQTSLVDHSAHALSTENSTSSYDDDEFGEGFDEEGFEGDEEFGEGHTDHLNSDNIDQSEENQHVTVSEQDTLDDFPEDPNEQHESASTAEAVPNVEQLEGEFDDDDFGEDDFDDHVVGDELDDPTISGTAFEDAQEPTQEDEDGLGNLSHVVHKNPSKRSLDETEFDVEESGGNEFDASPDSKRSRVL